MPLVSRLARVKRFVSDGALAVAELQETSKTLGLDPAGVVAVSFASEATDPSWYPQEDITSARRMTQVYFRLYLFESKLKRLVESILSQADRDGWFEHYVPEPVRKEAARKRAEEGMAKFHAARGSEKLAYLSISDLRRVVEANWVLFESRLYQKDWALGKLEELRLTRNAMAHMGDVSDDDLIRIDVILRDWNIQTA